MLPLNLENSKSKLLEVDRDVAEEEEDEDVYEDALEEFVESMPEVSPTSCHQNQVCKVGLYIQNICLIL